MPGLVQTGAQVRDRYVASRPRCLALLHEMRRVEPQPAWTPSPNVFVFAADQTGGRQRKQAGGGMGTNTARQHAGMRRPVVFLNC